MKYRPIDEVISLSFIFLLNFPSPIQVLASIQRTPFTGKFQ